jgi:membrane fusion protein (multidrug efflux system)
MSLLNIRAQAGALSEVFPLWVSQARRDARGGGALPLTACALTLLLSACQNGTGAPPPRGPQAVTFKTMAVQDVTVTRELPGRASAFLIAEVRPQVTGIVRQRLFIEGALVKAGEVLYQLEDASAGADLAIAEAAVQRAQATLNATRLTAKRAAELVEVNAISKQDNENAAAAQALAQADLSAAQAAVQRARVTVGFTRITAPIAGRIGKSSVTAGALVTANQASALATIQQLDPIYVDVTQSSSELLALRKEFSGNNGTAANLPVQVFLEDGSRTRQDGKLTFSDVTIDPATGSVGLRIAVPNADGLLLPGMYVRARIGNGVRRGALLVPQQGIARDPKGNTSAMLVGKDDKVEIRPVQVSRTIGDQWLVEGGLKPGDRVIVEGLQKIGPGAPVTASEFGSPPAAPTAAAAPAAAPEKK